MAENVRVPWFLRSRGRLLVTLALCVLLPLAVLSYLVVTESRRTLLAEAQRHDERAARLAARVVDNRFEGLRQIAESYARRPVLAELLEKKDADAVRDQLGEMVLASEVLSRAFITDASGVERYDFPHVPSVIGEDFSHRDWFRGVSAKGSTYVSEVYQRQAPPRRHLVAVATPIRGEEGDVLAYLVVQYTIHDLASWLGDLLPSHAGRIRLLGRSGRLAMAANPGEAPPAVSGPVLQQARGATEAGFMEARDPLHGDPSLISYAPASSLGGFVLVSRRLSDVFAPARALERWIYGLSLIAAAAMFVLGFLWLNIVRRQHLALVDLDAQKDLLTGMVIHDLRNPLTGALSFASLAKQEAPAAMKEDLAQIELALRRMEALVNNLLDVVKLEEGELSLRRQRFDVAEVVVKAARIHQASARLEGVELTCETSGPLQAASLDPEVTERITDNLIVNALKHTPSGGRVTVSLAEEEDEVRIIVADSGEGIPEEELPNLFQKFGRIKEQEGARSGDTGFGLLFCRMAAEVQGGRIWVKSEKGRGSEFVVALPRA